MNKGRTHSPDFKASIVKKLLAGEKAADLAKQHKIHESMIYAWKRKLASPDAGNKVDGRVSELKKKLSAQALQLIGEQALELFRLRRGN